MNQDALIYEKAKKKVITHLVIAWILMLLYFIGVYFVLNIDFLKVGNINSDIIILAAAHLCLYALLFLLLGFGKKIFRVLYWFGFIFTLLSFYIPFKYLISDFSNFLTYVSFAGFLLIEMMALSRLGHYLKKNKWARIFYDLTIDVYDDEPEEIMPTRKINPKPQVVVEPELEEEYEEEYIEEEEEKEPYTQPQVSVRLGICVYASLMAFPIVVQIFQNLFASYDLKTVFATKDIFLLCLLSALIWTAPVFYLYYNHYHAKRVCLICLGCEVVCILCNLPKFIGYISSGDYPIRVFILFVLVNILRYLALFFALKPLKDIEVEKPIEDEYE